MLDLPLLLILLTAREGCLCRNLTALPTRTVHPRPSLRRGVAAGVRANAKTGALPDYITGRNAVILFRH
jgi:hypothetical protein